MAYYSGSPGPLTTLLHAGIGAAGRIAGDYVSQALMQKRLEEMFSKQQSVGLLTDLLKGQSPEDYQKLAPIIESKLQEQGLFKSGLPKVTTEGFLPEGGSPTDKLMSLPEVYSAPHAPDQAFDVATGTKYAQPAENIKSLISREGSKWFSGLPEPQKGEVLKSAIAPKNPDLASMIALMGLQLKQGGQEFNRNLQTDKFGLEQQKYSLDQQKLGVQMQQLQEQINKSKETNKRLTSLEDLSARTRLDKLTENMNLAYKSGDMESAKRYMDQTNSLIQNHPNLGIEQFKLESPTGWKSYLPWSKPSISGGTPTGKTTSTESTMSFPRRVIAGGQEVVVNSQEEYDNLKAKYTK